MRWSVAEAPEYSEESGCSRFSASDFRVRSYLSGTRRVADGRIQRLGGFRPVDSNRARDIHFLAGSFLTHAR